MKKGLPVKKEVLKAYVFHDKAEKLYTVSLAGKGGPIISEDSYDKAVSSFERALKLSTALLNLQTYKDYIVGLEKEEKVHSENLMNEPEVHYENVAA